MKNKLIIILSSIMLLGILVVYLILPKNNFYLENIGIGGGGAFFTPLVDPVDNNTIYVTCDMGGLYYSYDRGKTWGRTESRGVLNIAEISEDGTIFAGGYGLYSSSDKGKTLKLIYPQDVKRSVSRCGWNENLMLAEGFDNGFLKCVATTSDKVYFATIDWNDVNLKVFECDYNGDNLALLHTEKLGISNPVNGIDMYMLVENNILYFTLDDKIKSINLENNEINTIFSTTGAVVDFKKIGDKFFILESLETETKILYTQDFAVYQNLQDFNNLTNKFEKYGQNHEFLWKFKEISGNNFENIYISFSAYVDTLGDTVDGIMKFDGEKFNWIFDSMYHTRHNTEIEGGWSYGSHGPFYGIFADPKDDDFCLVSNIESVYLLKFEDENNRRIIMNHCKVNGDNTYSTTGLNVQTTYSVKEDPFNSNHIIICTTDLGLQNSYDNGKTWKRMEITGTDYDIYNTCYDLYFDTKQKDLVYGLWSSRHDAPYNPTLDDKGHTKGAFAVSTDGGNTWNFEYSTGIPKDSIPVKMSVVEKNNKLMIAVATFNNGFYLSYDSGKTFEPINNNMAKVQGFIWGEDVVITGNIIYCLTAPYNCVTGYWESACLYEYNISTKTTLKVDLGDLVLVRSLTYHKEKGLYLNVIPMYEYEWFEEYNDGIFVNKDGGIYKYENSTLTCVFENTDGIFHSAFSPDGIMYATDTYGKLFVEKDGEFEVYVEGLFNMLKNISFSLNGKVVYVTAFGGGTYRMPTINK